MSHHPTDFEGSVTDAISAAVAEAIPGAEIHVEGGGGHFTIAVTSAVFEGKSTLQRHRLVLQAIAPLMAGDRAPVHAVDKLTTTVPSNQ